jgi:hypothetical protein
MKPIASLSLDLDNLWSYMKTHGDSGWESFPSYFEKIVPRILSFLADRDLIITFFVVGQDLCDSRSRSAIQAVASAGHEIGNHSFSHEPWMHQASEARIEKEISRTEELIEAFTKTRPIGFRGPGYSSSPKILNVLRRRGYMYDASRLPTWVGPLARTYYFLTSQLDTGRLKERQGLFGSFRDCWQPLNAHSLGSDLGGLLEIPVTTMPLFRVPIHVSYILYLATFSRTMAISYFRFAMSLCHLTGVQPSLLLHPLDFTDCDEVPTLKFFPAMGLGKETKAKLVATILDIYCAEFSVLTLKGHAEHVALMTNHAAAPQQLSVF